MGIGDIIITGGFFLFLILVIFSILWFGIVTVYCNYHISKESNKIQWECKETYWSQVRYENGDSFYHTCDLQYYVIPNELPKFVRIFGKNEKTVAFQELEFNNEQEFKNFVSRFETVGDIKKHLRKEQRVIWTHP